MLADLSAICWALKVSKSTVFCAQSALFCFLSDLDMDLKIQSDVFDMLSAVLTVSANTLSHALCSGVEIQYGAHAIRGYFDVHGKH